MKYKTKINDILLLNTHLIKCLKCEPIDKQKIFTLKQIMRDSIKSAIINSNN